MAHEFYCVSCGSSLSQYRANTPVRDFYSAPCQETFQLKASSTTIGNKIMGANFEKFRQSILGSSQPSLILLHYDQPNWLVKDLSIIHRACITLSCIERRNPLKETARRPGWVGCNIILNAIPKLGQIEVVNDGRIMDKRAVTEQWKRISGLLQWGPIRRGWLADVLRCVERLDTTFTIRDAYTFESELASKHRDNHNIRAKIRQQLQVLRDLGIIEFVIPGVYRHIQKPQLQR